MLSTHFEVICSGMERKEGNRDRLWPNSFSRAFNSESELEEQMNHANNGQM